MILLKRLIPEATTAAEVDILQAPRQFLQGQFPSQLLWRSRDSSEEHSKELYNPEHQKILTWLNMLDLNQTSREYNDLHVYHSSRALLGGTDVSSNPQCTV